MNKEICWNIINSILAGALVFLGALTDGTISGQSVLAAAIVSASVAILQFKKYWESEEDEYCRKTLGTFIP